MLKPMYRGDTKRWHLTTQTDITGGTIYLMIKRKASDVDTLALVDTTWTLDAPDGLTGEIKGASVEITPDKSATFPVGSVHVGIKYVSSGGVAITLYSGPMQIRREGRKAS